MGFRNRRAVPALILTVLIGLLAMPAAYAQEGPLYFPITGHSLADDQGFLSFWRAHDGERLLGYPITEAFDAGGQFVQYFMRGRLEQQVDPATGASQVRTGRVAAEYAEALFRAFAPAPPRRAAPNIQTFPSTGHTLRAPFLAFWQANGGEEFFGAPISEALWEMTEQGQRQVQYFERARLERDSNLAGTPDEIQVSELGRALAQLRALDTAPRDNFGAEMAGPSEPAAAAAAPLTEPAEQEQAAPAEELYPAQPPEPIKAAPAPAKPAAPARAARPKAAAAPAPRASVGGKRILIDLGKQWLYAYQNDELVFDAPIATGRDGMETPAGNFAVYAKTKAQTMRGVTDGEGWVVPNVPNVMYINGDIALHGTYWHNLFGTGVRVSHGCVNLPLDAAAWLYDWSPIGTPVRVTY
jgi:lipoprotein-anchoring transpeptidase ErfK/SrfK